MGNQDHAFCGRQAFEEGDVDCKICSVGAGGRHPFVVGEDRFEAQFHASAEGMLDEQFGPRAAEELFCLFAYIGCGGGEIQDVHDCFFWNFPRHCA